MALGDDTPVATIEETPSSPPDNTPLPAEPSPPTHDSPVPVKKARKPLTDRQIRALSEGRAKRQQQLKDRRNPLKQISDKDIERYLAERKKQTIKSEPKANSNKENVPPQEKEVRFSREKEIIGLPSPEKYER